MGSFYLSLICMLEDVRIDAKEQFMYEIRIRKNVLRHFISYQKMIDGLIIKLQCHCHIISKKFSLSILM